MAEDTKSEQVIETSLGEITQEQVDDFRQATRASIPGVPPTFSTRFRDAEYQWLDRLGVDMRYLLHAEQEYDFHQPLQVGQKILVRSRVGDKKIRKRANLTMEFYKLYSDVLADEKLAVGVITTFVVKTPTSQEGS